MTEWRLFPAGTVPDFTTPAFFEAHPWIDPIHQRGHAERTAMVADLVRKFVAEHKVTSIVDLGCGDGSLLGQIRDLPMIPMWGYDAGTQNVHRAQVAGLDVRPADLLTSPVEYGDLIVATEVVEHLLDPHHFIASLPGDKLILSSPSAETGDWHYVHHAWAWDMDGYAALAESCGWTIVDHVECDGQDNDHGGVRRPQRFQAMSLVRRKTP